MEEGEEDGDGDGKIEYNQRTFSQSCTTLFPNNVHLEKIQDAVFRMNKIKMLAGELLTMHIHRCLENSIPLPKFTQTWCKQLFKEVSIVDKGTGKNVITDDPELSMTMRNLKGDIDRPSRSLLDQMLSSEATSLQAIIVTNIGEHYKKRVLRFVRWTFHTQEMRVLSPDQYKILKLEMLQITEDMCRHGSRGYTSPACYHAWIDQYRQFFKLSSLLETRSLNDVKKNDPELLLPSMHLMNRAFEGSGLSSISILPLTRKFRPGFVHFDNIIFRQVLSMPQSESRKQQIKASQLKKQNEVANATYLPPKEKAKRKREEREKEYESAKVQRQFMIENETEEQKKVRIEVEKKIKLEKQRLLNVQKQEKKQEKMEEHNSFFTSFLNNRINPPKGYTFNFSIRTDGVSARLIYVKKIVLTNETIKWKNRTPKRGLYTIDQIKYFSRLSQSDMQVIGVDPGVHDLIHAVSFDEMLNVAQSKSIKFSSAQRRFDRCSTLFLKRMCEEKTETIISAERELSKYNSRSSHIDTLEYYFTTRRMHMKEFYNFYGMIRYRTRRWKTFKKDQKSLSKLVDNIRSLNDQGKTMVIAYGAWANVSSKFKNKGIAPCIGIGLRRYLSKHFIVADTPEHYTSQTCSGCLGKCGPFKELEERRKQEKLTMAVTEEEKKKASRYTIRSIRRCQNAECGAILHRDKNAARNIADNFIRLYSGKPPFRKQSKDDQELEELTCSICFA